MNLVTGATGHIGNVLVRELIQRGEKVRVFILPNEDMSPLKDLDVEIFRGDVRDINSLIPAFKGVDNVFHLAGLISIMPGFSQVVHDVNVQGTLNMIDVASQHSINRFIYTSSIHAFKRVPHGIVIDENIAIEPESNLAAYDRSKAEATLAVLERAKQGFPAVIVCPTGVIGPYDFKSSEMGELVNGWMSTNVNFLIEGQYDFVDVRDVVQGMLLARDKGQVGQIYILSGDLISVTDLWHLVKELLSLRSRFINIPSQFAKFLAFFSQIYYRISKTKPKFTTYSIDTLHANAVISNNKARQILGYQPRSLRESIQDTISWWKQNGLSLKIKKYK